MRAKSAGSALAATKLHGPRQAGRAEPAAGHQRVVVVAAGVDEDVRHGVGGPQQLRAGDGHEVGLTLEDDQLGRCLADDDGRHAMGQRGFRVGAGPAVEQVDMALLAQLPAQIVQAQRLGIRARPGAGDARGTQPAVIDVHVQLVREAALQDQRLRVHDALEARIGARGLPHRRAIDRHQDGGRVAHHHLRCIVLHLQRYGLDAGRGHRGLQTIQRNAAQLRRQAGLQCRGVGGATIRQRREIGLGDLQVLEHHHAADLVDLRSRGGEDHAEGLLRGTRGFDGECGTQVNLVADPAVHLRLIHQHCGVGQADVARPGVGGQIGGRGRRRGLGPGSAAKGRAGEAGGTQQCGSQGCLQVHRQGSLWIKKF